MTPPTPLLLRRFRTALACLAVVALTGCASLPSLPPRTESHAFADTEATDLGRLERASLAGAEGDESGFRLLPNGGFAFDARLAIVRRAERSVDAQYYQVQRDGVGLTFLRELRDAAARGVRVRLLVDDLYTAGEDELFATFAAIPNVEVRLFNPLPARGSSLVGRLLFSLHDFSRINHRMHNKLLVADNRFAVSGGRNIADEYFMRSAAANFIDMDVISTGPVVRELSSVFDRYWNSAYSYPVGAVVGLAFDAAAAERRFDEAVQVATPDIAPGTSDPLGRAPVGFELATGRLSVTAAKARVLADAPEKVANTRRDDGVSTVIRSVMAVVRQARTEVIVVSPYFIPGPIGLEIMKHIIGNGARSIVLTNSLGATDEPLVHWRYARYRRAMLELGVDIYELSPDLAQKSGTFGDFGKSFGRLHAKVVMIDRRHLFIGSMNIDSRSAWSNTEAGLMIESPALAELSYSLLARDRFESVYKLRLAADGKTIQWLTTDGEGRQTVLDDEPHSHWLQRLKSWLLEPFASEELL